MVTRTSFIGGLLLVAVTACAAEASVCISIDESRDMLSTQERTAAVQLVARQFEMAGETIATDQCDSEYLVSHVVLGRTIVVTMSGPHGQIDGRALGFEDLPALYSQMVRSMMTGKPMSGFNVIDRTNVTDAQQTTHRVNADSFTYVRLGYGAVAGISGQGGPAVGFGHRVELDSFAVDVSFLNYQIQQGSGYGADYYGGGGGVSGSLVKLEALRFRKPAANATSYYGGGFSWARTAFSDSAADGYTSWQGSGLQGELTAGYEFPRASTVRMFIQADAGIPFFKTTGIRYPRFGTSSRTAAITDRRYLPTITISAGLGWQRHRP